VATSSTRGRSLPTILSRYSSHWDCRYHKVAKSDIENGQEDHLLQLSRPFPEFVGSPSHLATEEVDEDFRPKGCPSGFLLSLASPLKVM
jgi:hypothetical protein